MHVLSYDNGQGKFAEKLCSIERYVGVKTSSYYVDGIIDVSDNVLCENKYNLPACMHNVTHLKARPRTCVKV